MIGTTPGETGGRVMLLELMRTSDDDVPLEVTAPLQTLEFSLTGLR